MEFTTVIVDDDEISLLLLKQIIKITNFHVAPQIFNGAQKALDFLQGRPDKNLPVIIFLDINMPIMTGWDLLHILQKDDFNKELYVIIVSSSVNAKDKEKAFSFSKVIDFVEKPFDVKAIERLKLKLTWL